MILQKTERNQLRIGTTHIDLGVFIKRMALK